MPRNTKMQPDFRLGKAIGLLDSYIFSIIIKLYSSYIGKRNGKPRIVCFYDSCRPVWQGSFAV